MRAFSAGPAYLPEAQALFDRFTTPPTTARKNLINDLFAALMEAGVYSKLDAFYIFAQYDEQAALQNWVADQYNSNPVNSPTFTVDRDYVGNGTSSYLDSQFNPSTAVAPHFVQNSAYFGAWSRTAGALAGSSAGYFDGTKGVTLQPRDGSNNTVGRINQAAAASALGTATDGSGLFSVSRSASNVLRIARNGTNTGTGTTVSTTVANGTLRFGNFGTASYSTLRFAAGIIGSNITQPEEAAMYAAILAYMQAVGAA